MAGARTNTDIRHNELLEELKAIAKRLDQINHMLDVMLKARGIKK